jgi:hypothetical protein
LHQQASKARSEIKMLRQAQTFSLPVLAVVQQLDLRFTVSVHFKHQEKASDEDRRDPAL